MDKSRPRTTQDVLIASSACRVYECVRVELSRCYGMLVAITLPFEQTEAKIWDPCAGCISGPEGE